MSKPHRALLTMVIMGLLFAGSGAQEVEHAPTVEQCRADQRLWLETLENTSSRKAQTYKTLDGWDHEMLECYSVDPENQRRYYNVMGEIDTDQNMRLEDFLKRHGLYDKFIEEDKAGTR